MLTMEFKPSDVIKAAFCNWLSNEYAEISDSEDLVASLDKASQQLLQRKLLPFPLWEITNHDLFKDVYNEVINDKLFILSDKKTHTAFVRNGKLYLKFLKTKPSLDRLSTVRLESQDPSNSNLTIREAIIRVLETEQNGMTVEQIYQKIIANRMYAFGAKNPQRVIRVEIDRACENSNYSIRAPKNYFKCERNQKGEKIYFLLPEIHTKETAKKIYTEQKPETTNNVQIWNDSIKQSFQSWMESKDYAPATIKNYCSIIHRLIQNCKSLEDAAISDSLTVPEAVNKFIELLNQNVGLNAVNNAALTVFAKFAKSFEIMNLVEGSSVSSDADSYLNNIVDLDEGIMHLRRILDTHFLALYKYSNINILWSAAQNSMSMFLNDNAINSADGLWYFITRALKDDFVFNYPHIWEEPPDYPLNLKGLIINLACQYGGVVTREQIDDFFSQIKLKTLYNSQVLDDDQLLFYDKGKFILTEIVNPDADNCSLITEALNMLFSSEKTPYIILRDIKTEWFSTLPKLPNGLQWTPLLLQELLRIRPDIGYRVIMPKLKGQALDTVGAAIVPEESEIETFADVVHRFCSEEYKLPYKLSAEELRIKLREVGMLEGNELIYNMYKALKDYRFAFSDENRTVMILER